MVLSTDTVIGVSDAVVRVEVRAGSLIQLTVDDLPEIFAEMGIVTVRNRTPSPMAQHAIACVQKVAAGVNAPAEPPNPIPTRKG